MATNNIQLRHSHCHRGIWLTKFNKYKNKDFSLENAKRQVRICKLLSF